VHLAFIAFYLLVFDINVLAGFSTFSATVLALTFVFGDSVKQTFQSAVWLFANHPLDVGDYVQLPPDDTWLRVKKFGLVDTVFVRENGDVVHVPNLKLIQGTIVNLTRSGRRTELVRLLLDGDAPAALRDDLETALRTHFSGPGSGHLSGEVRVRYSGITPEGKARLSAAWTYAFGATDAKYPAARDAAIAAVKGVLAASGGGALHTLQVRSVPFHAKHD
jgi:hypothetical protein